MKKFHVKCTRYYVGEQDITVLVHAEDEAEAREKALYGNYEEEVDECMKHEGPNERACEGGWEVTHDVKEVD
jgi:hypothetical protein